MAPEEVELLRLCWLVTDGICSKGGIVNLAGIGDKSRPMSAAEPADPSPYRGYRFPPEIIAHAVWLYFRFHLSFRDVQDLLAERCPAANPRSSQAARS